MDKNLCPCHSVGAVIHDPAGRFLVLYRRSFPQGLAFVAGHGEEGENPEVSLKREVLEESGIIVKKYELVLHQTFKNSCSKGFGSHKWWVYDISEWEGEPRVCEPAKHEFVKFISLEEIRTYIERNDVDPAWGMFIWPALFQSHRFPFQI